MSFEHIKSIKSLYFVHNPCALNCAIFSVLGNLLHLCNYITQRIYRSDRLFTVLSSLFFTEHLRLPGLRPLERSRLFSVLLLHLVCVLCMIWSGFCSLCCLFWIVYFHSSSVYHPLETRLSLPLFLQQCSEFVDFFSL